MILKVLAVLYIIGLFIKWRVEANYTRRTGKPAARLWETPKPGQSPAKSGHDLSTNSPEPAKLEHFALPQPGYDWRSKFKKPIR